MSGRSDQTDVSVLEKRRICARCVADRHLRQLSEKGKRGKCSYGHGATSTLTLKRVAKLIRGVLKNHYKIVPKNIEGELTFGDEDVSLLKLINILTGVKEELAMDLQCYLEKSHQNRLGSDNPFENSVNYRLDNAHDLFWEGRWSNLQEHIIKENRSFNKKAKRILKLIFSDISAHESARDVPLIKTYETGEARFFRARVFQSSDKLIEALEKPVKCLGPPPSELAKAGRLNARGIAAFYGATSADIAIAEVRPPVGSQVVVASFENIRPLKLLDIEALSSIVETSPFDPMYGQKSGKERFISSLGDKISAPVMPDDESIDYLVTQVVADYLSSMLKPRIDGIMYRSMQIDVEEKGKKNVFLFYKSARISYKGISKKIRASDDYGEGVYTILLSEKTIKTHAPPNADGKDRRMSKLRLDISNLVTHHVNSVVFDSPGDKVSLGS